MNKITNILGQELTFYDYNENHSPTLIMIHGNSLNASLFRDTVQSSLFSAYRIILLELPGHGNAKRSTDPEETYSVKNFINLLVAFIKESGITNYVLFGHSLGGHIAINAIPALNDIKGLAISGTPPLTMPPDMGACFLPNPAMGLAFKPDLPVEEVALLAENFVTKENVNFSLVKEAIAETDPLARVYIGRSIATEQLHDETQLVHNSSFPIAVLHGENDRMINLNYLESLKINNLWRNKIQVIKGASHCTFLENSAAFNTTLAQFLHDCF